MLNNAEKLLKMKKKQQPEITTNFNNFEILTSSE